VRDHRGEGVRLLVNDPHVFNINCHFLPPCVLRLLAGPGL
jgi:hypothetical protein